jgi:hypothetical protein
VTRQRLMFLLGGAAMGALLGAFYANHLYNQRSNDPLKVYNSPQTAEEPTHVREEPDR